MLTGCLFPYLVLENNMRSAYTLYQPAYATCFIR